MKFFQYKIRNSYQMPSYYYRGEVFSKDWSNPIEEGLIPETNSVLLRREVEIVVEKGVEEKIEEFVKEEKVVESKRKKQEKKEEPPTIFDDSEVEELEADDQED